MQITEIHEGRCYRSGTQVRYVKSNQLGKVKYVARGKQWTKDWEKGHPDHEVSLINFATAVDEEVPCHIDLT
jgi:hypothetical protein